MGLVVMTLHSLLLPVGGLKDSLLFRIMALGSTANKLFFPLQGFLFSNQTPKTLRSDFPLGLVITSLEHGSSRAGVRQAEILQLREGAVAAPQFLHRSCRSDSLPRPRLQCCCAVAKSPHHLNNFLFSLGLWNE